MSRLLSLSQAGAALPAAQRVLVIGGAGAGKTTLARRLSNRFDLPYQSLDRDARWLPGWTLRATEEQRPIIARLAGAGRWVMDGGDPASLALSLPRADLVLWLRIPRGAALRALLWRSVAQWGRVRPGMARGCPERLPRRDALAQLWHYERDTAPLIDAALGGDVPVAILRSPGDIARLLNT